MENALVGEEVCKCYEKIANEWLKKIPIEMVKYLLDYNAIEAEVDSDKNVSEKLEKLFEKYLISKSVYEDYFKEEKGVGFTAFQKALWDILAGWPNQINTLEKKINQDNFLQHLQDKLLHCEAFFDIKEFVLLGYDENYKSKILECIGKPKENDHFQ